ncbi:MULTISPECIES: 30S ribosome-binding factor RbfA [unclassified Paenibacillus]|uniref:30S ribosome-binding factor RbfA n=1 Tax=unclassified Paenibacillus TaxID=185978 RepID=UPI001AEAE98E|nr:MULTISPECIES: 30S ribosome-binding factor RbfA [unclassified Paenibacillus]MBP1155962.1 ribosome-binding factor A [Paenibacillus sp. PvP091]MBP1168652.1 ribosome-binding factor A [Paenibacillus sp. PvR098]MBP2439680.1 ribosome-binding factor A [Paenibacillus sp. PvP052]
MAKIRVGRVGEQIKKELSQIIQSELKDPRIGFITVTGVDVTNEFSHAKVYLSVLGSDEQKQETLKALTRSTGFIRSELGKRIRMRKIPELLFKFDESIDYGSKIQGLLQKINQENPNV